LHSAWLFAVLGIVVAVVGGCGGGSNGQVPVVAGGGVVAAAAFVGRAVCAVCHADINTEYSDTAHGLDFTNAHGRNLVQGGCEPCHSVGYQEGGFVSLATTPQLASIGCEECHGAGSKHAGAPSDTTISGVPNSEETCWDCHVNSYKILRHHPGPISDIDLSTKVPNKVSISHPQAIMLNGVQAYNQPVSPSPHSVIDNTCVACHLNPEHGIVTLASSPDPVHGEGALDVDLPTCVPCHGPQSASKALFDNLETEVKTKMIELGGQDPANPGSPDPALGGGFFAAFVTNHGIKLTTNTTPSDPYVQAYKGARHNYVYLIKDKSNGAHNPPMARAMLAAAKLALSN
jgi:hypothetical protein